jgi:hypothetical protein
MVAELAARSETSSGVFVIGDVVRGTNMLAGKVVLAYRNCPISSSYGTGIVELRL